jgi:menaquinone reductase, molybdopterin-binding-like subunit
MSKPRSPNPIQPPALVRLGKGPWEGPLHPPRASAVGLSPPALTRRREVLGAALAGAALLGCRKKAPTRISKPALREARGWRAGEERWVLSTCTLCEAGCGIKVRVVEGRAVKIEGNPEHPVNHGGLCSRGQAGLQLLYSPDRVRSPLRRVGARGAGQWQPLSWEQAIAEVADKLAALRASGHPERVVMLDGQTSGFVPELWTRLLGALGSRNHVAFSSPTLAGMDLAAGYIGDRLPAYDVEGARLVLLLGSEGMESSGHALRLWQAQSAPAEHGRGRRLRVICVSPRRPDARVDEWIPILPGGYGALALSLVHVLLRDRLADQRFIDAHVRDRLAGYVLGVPEGEHERFERSGLQWVQATFAPDKTASATGIAPATVERLARELAKQRPSLLLGSASVAAASNGLASAMAALMVNVLLGNVGQEGGVRWQENPKLSAWDETVSDEIARQGLQNPRIDGVGSEACALGDHRAHALPEAIMQGKPHPVEILLVRKADPLSTLPGRQAWTSALHKVPFLVSFASRLDRTAMLADLILPESTPLETWDVVTPVPASGEPLLGLCQPVVTTVHDTRPAGDVIIQLAEIMGGVLRKAVPWPGYQDAVKARLQGVAQAENNEYVGTLMASMKDKGGWWRDDDGDERSASEPDIIRLASLAIFSRTQIRQGGQVKRLSSSWPVEGLPPWEPARFAGAANEFPYTLHAYRPASSIDDGNDACSWLQELPLAGVGTRAEMHPEAAARLGLGEGDAVTVESPAGACAATVHVSDGVRPGVVAMALGRGEVLDLLVVDEDRLAGLLAWQGTRVRVRKTS